MYKFIFSIILLMVILVSCKMPKDIYDVIIPSPNGQIHLHFNLHKGEPYYLVYLDDEIVVGWSLLGFTNDGLAKGIPSGETLQENMLLTEVVPVKNDDDISQIFVGEKYNSLKVHLQKQGDKEIGYDVVFLIYNDSIVFWYEYNSDLKKIINDLKENTEFDLNTKNQQWWLSDTIQMTDTLFFPVKFSSDLSINLTISQIISEKNNAAYLLQREENIPEFLISMDNPAKTTDNGSIVKTDKKSIHIYRNI